MKDNNSASDENTSDKDEEKYSIRHRILKRAIEEFNHEMRAKKLLSTIHSDNSKSGNKKRMVTVLRKKKSKAKNKNGGEPMPLK